MTTRWCKNCGHPEEEHTEHKQWLECGCCDEGMFEEGGHAPAPKPIKERKRRIVADKAAMRKKFWQVMDDYASGLIKEFKRNNTIEGKSLGTKEESSAALRVITNQAKVISKKANVKVAERKNGRGPAKKAAKAKKSKKTSGAFDTIPDPS